MSEGIRLTDEGRFPEALDAFLWCWDHGNEADVGFYGVRVSFLLMYVRNLADLYPPCVEAFAQRKAELIRRRNAGELDRHDELDLRSLEREGF